MSEIQLFGPKYLQRKAHDEKVIEKMKAREANWNTRTGDYEHRNYIEDGHPYQFKSDRGEIAPGYLSFLAKTIDDQLKLSVDKPVVAIDIGGQDGKSWRDLAKYFQAEVKSGRLVFIISNVETRFQPLASESEGVIFMEGTTEELLQGKVNTPVGEVVLKGNTNFVHERLSVSNHSIIPERDVDNLVQLVSDTGIYFSGDKTAGTFFKSPTYNVREKQIALDMTREKAQEVRGLVQVPILRRGPNQGLDIKGYVLKAPNAPELYG